MPRFGFILISLFVVFGANVQGQNSAQGPEYYELIEAYQALSAEHNNATLLELGATDSGKPLSLFLVQKEEIKTTDLSEIRKNKLVILINNGIHPGESCGIEASLNWIKRSLAEPLQKDLLIAIIPVYNIGGLLQRRPHTRANQNGPKMQGFRGNARNLDLNRDFIKADARNTFQFYQVFQALQPHIFIDTHTSNGADYAYTMTLISTLADKLAPPMADLLKEEMEPALYASMAMKNWEMTPYVNVFGRSPDNGFSAFLESPRYASGYTALFNTIGFISEAHMFKPYPDRGAATEAFLESVYEYSAVNGQKVIQAKMAAEQWQMEANSFPIDWALDSTVVEELNFKGFHSANLESHLGPYKRLKYFRDSAKNGNLNYYPHYRTAVEAHLPQYYVLPFAQKEIIERLQAHNIEMYPLANDTVISCDFWQIEDFEFGRQPYEGHFRIENVDAKLESAERKFYKGDFLIPARQANAYFLASVLHPKGRDSYISWGFMHSIFGRKEYFSPYVFEDTAAEILEQNPIIQAEFKAWQKANPAKAKSAYESLNWIYQRSDFMEVEYLRYPIGFIN